MLTMETRTLTVLRGHKDIRTGVWTQTETLALADCMVDYTSSAEQTSGGDVVEIDATVYVRSAQVPDVLPTDRFEIDGTTFAVVGRPAPFAWPATGDTAGTTIRLTAHLG